MSCPHLQVHLRRLGSRSGRERRGKREMDKEDVVTVKTGASEERKVLGGLQPFSHYATSVSAFNSKGEGPHSEPINFHTPEGGEGGGHVWLTERGREGLMEK